MIQFLEHIFSSKVQDGEDILIYEYDRRGELSVKSYYNSLGAENNLIFLAKEIWGSRAPLRTHFCAWKAVWGKILIVGMLMKRGSSMVNGCSLCKDSEELTDHILIHCDKTRDLWTLLLATFGLVGVFLTSMRNLLLK